MHINILFDRQMANPSTAVIMISLESGNPTLHVSPPAQCCDYLPENNDLLLDRTINTAHIWLLLSTSNGSILCTIYIDGSHKSLLIAVRQLAVVICKHYDFLPKYTLWYHFFLPTLQQKVMMCLGIMWHYTLVGNEISDWWAMICLRTQENGK